MNIRGTGVAVITPFDQKQHLDDSALRRILQNLIKGRVEYLVMLGTTGESATLTKDEKKQVIQIAQEETNGQIPLVVGIGGNNTSDVLDNLSATDLGAFQGILSVTPYYNKPNQQGILQHFRQIADHSPLPVILYNVPGRTGKNIEASTTLQLAEHPNIQGIKEASGDPWQVMEIIQQKPDDFQVVSGDDHLTLPYLGIGTDGVISVTANGFPLLFSEMVRAGLSNDYDKARQYHYKVMDVMRLAFTEGNPTGIKAAMNIKGLCENILRLPLVPASDHLYKEIGKVVKQFD